MKIEGMKGINVVKKEGEMAEKISVYSDDVTVFNTIVWIDNGLIKKVELTDATSGLTYTFTVSQLKALKELLTKLEADYGY